MAQKIEVKILGDAVPMGRPRSSVVNGHVHVYQPEKSQQYKAYVRMCVMEKMHELGIQTMEGPVTIHMTFILPIPKSFSRKKRQLAIEGEIWPTKKPDLDNLAKSILDAINGVAFLDDSQVIAMWIYKRYGQQGAVHLGIEDTKESEDE